MYESNHTWAILTTHMMFDGILPTKRDLGVDHSTRPPNSETISDEESLIHMCHGPKLECNLPSPWGIGMLNPL